MFAHLSYTYTNEHVHNVHMDAREWLCPKNLTLVVLSSDFQQQDHLWFAQLITVSKAVSLLPKRANVRIFFKAVKLLRMQLFQVGYCGCCKISSHLKKALESKCLKNFHIAKLRAFVTHPIQPGYKSTAKNKQTNLRVDNKMITDES